MRSTQNREQEGHDVFRIVERLGGGRAFRWDFGGGFVATTFESFEEEGVFEMEGGVVRGRANVVVVVAVSAAGQDAALSDSLKGVTRCGFKEGCIQMEDFKCEREMR